MGEHVPQMHKVFALVPGGGVAVETFCINLSETYLHMLFKIGAKPSVYVCVYMSVSM